MASKTSKTQARTKSGKMVDVLVIPAGELSASLETRAFEAAKCAAEQGCPFWRIADADGRILQKGSAAAPVMTREQAAATSGPQEDRRDW